MRLFPSTMLLLSADDECAYSANLLCELGYDLGIITFMCDNESAVRILSNPLKSDRSKYAELLAHHVCEQVEGGEVQVITAATKDMLADCLTKTLTP
jgi:hypothetical protein